MGTSWIIVECRPLVLKVRNGVALRDPTGRNFITDDDDLASGGLLPHILEVETKGDGRRRWRCSQGQWLRERGGRRGGGREGHGGGGGCTGRRSGGYWLSSSLPSGGRVVGSVEERRGWVDLRSLGRGGREELRHGRRGNQRWRGHRRGWGIGRWGEARGGGRRGRQEGEEGNGLGMDLLYGSDGEPRSEAGGQMGGGDSHQLRPLRPWVPGPGIWE